MSGWIDTAREIHVSDVASRLGYEVRKAPSAYHCACPACGAEKRHTKSRDRRGAVGMPVAKPTLWHCWQCEAGSDSIDFVSYHLGDSKFRELTQERREEVKAWFGVSESGPAHEPARKGPPRLTKQALGVEFENIDTRYPPIGEIEALWEACVPVDCDEDVLWYLGHRGILNAARLIEHDCARALPAGAVCPEWARVAGRPWTETGHRLIVPLYDWQGELRSVLARSAEHNPTVKSVGATGYGRRGLVMAGTYGRQMLVSGATRHLHRLENFRLEIYEGEINALRAISNGADRDVEDQFTACAFRGVVGIFSGAFTRDVASRVPSGSTVVIATDDDDQGRKYGGAIVAAIGDRVSFEWALEASDAV